jgi:uncharacterized protein YdiU (UPF0061 family)
LALSASCIKEWIPELDVGDSFEYIGKGKLSANKMVEVPDGNLSGDAEARRAVRQELVDILSGHAVLMQSSIDSDPENGISQRGYAPWSLKYSGHQFGSWAGQLGDGRAISILEVPHPNDPDTTYELQLKGAGRTPFSRSADGLAVLRSSVREFLGAEAMHALQIPTTRSLSLISLPELLVERESVETASIVTRVAPSFIRVGNFQATNPPQNMSIFYLGASGSNTLSMQSQQDWEAMRLLGEWVSRRVLKLEGFGDGRKWAKDMLWESARRNAKMVAGWQAYGYENGVMNTDNISIAGLTIDYGPWAFMDVYDQNWVCNHSDTSGRYAFKNQPAMIVYAMQALLNAIAPMIGAESQLGRAVAADWAASAPKDQLDLWKADGLELGAELERFIFDEVDMEYRALMRKRLGLRKVDPKDEELIESLLYILQTHGLDYSSTLRSLTTFRPEFLGSAQNSSLEHLLSALTSSPNNCDIKSASDDWLGWLEKFKVRIELDANEWKSDAGSWLETREKEMKNYNPRFVPRQWVMEELIKKLQEDEITARPMLTKILEMTTNPFKPWGAEGDNRLDDELDIETREERRFCGLGPKNLLGFQCSCSS